MLKKLLIDTIRRLTGGIRRMPVIHISTPYEFETDKPTHLMFSVVQLGKISPNTLQVLRELAFQGAIKESISCLKLVTATVSTFEGIIEYSNKKKLLAVLKSNDFHSVLMTPYLEIGQADGRKILVEARLPDDIRPRTKVEGTCVQKSKNN